MGDIVKYILNDLSTPDLIVDTEIPAAPPFCPFKVDGYNGGSSQIDTLEHQAACCQLTIINGINLINKYVNVSKWSNTSQLTVQPRAGKQFNAFYDRAGLRFFYSFDPVAKKMIYAVDSTEVVSHELGHALLDAIRPDLYHMQAMEVWAFHEAFGDMNAILNNLQHPELTNRALSETNGDLRKSNVCTRLAEDMGLAIFHVSGGRMGYSSAYLRDAVNSFNYTEPEKLPGMAPDNLLSSECHSFSRVFTAAWYDALVGIYEQERATSESAAALIVARDVMASYTYRAMPIAAATVRFYDSVARAILVIDKGNGYKYNKAINDAFINRGILREVVKPMVALDWLSFKTSLNSGDEVFESSSASAIRDTEVNLISLPSLMMTATVPLDYFYEFNASGQCVGMTGSSPQEAVDHAYRCVDYLKSHSMIRSDTMAPFEISNEGELMRSHFACGCGGGGSCGGCSGGCCGNNCSNPQAPEFLKCWKSDNNTGCRCGGKRCGEPKGHMAVRSKSINRVPVTIDVDN